MSWAGKRDSRWAERGAVTAELATTTPIYVLFLIALLAAANAGFAQAQACNHARTALRAATLGQAWDGPATVKRDGDWLTARSERPLWKLLGSVHCELKTIAEPEP